MTVTVTGATGHIGANLARALIEERVPVRALIYEKDRNVGSIATLDVERVAGDVLDPASLRKAFDGAEVVFHLASLISLDGADTTGIVHRVNVEGTRNVVDACLACGVKKLVHFGSVHTMQAPPSGSVFDESRPLIGDVGLLYDRTKAAGVRAVLAGVERGLDAVIVHPTAVIGPYDFEPSRMGKVFLDLFHRKLVALITGGYDWVDVRDVVQGAILAAKHGRTGEGYLLGGRYLSIRELAGIVETITGIPAPRFTTPMWVADLSVPFAGLYAKARGRVPVVTADALEVLRHSRVVSHEKASRELGYRPRALAETIHDTLEWHMLARDLTVPERFTLFGRVGTA